MVKCYSNTSVPQASVIVVELTQHDVTVDVQREPEVTADSRSSTASHLLRGWKCSHILV
jgi:hypothetical protein